MDDITMCQLSVNNSKCKIITYTVAISYIIVNLLINNIESISYRYKCIYNLYSFLCDAFNTQTSTIKYFECVI